MMPADVVVVTTVVAADRATALAVFTEEIGAWWRRGQRFRFHPERDGVLRFEPGVGWRLIDAYEGHEAYEVGRVLAWEPAGRLVFEFRVRALEPDEYTEVEVRFQRVDAGTRVTIIHRG
jgi:activator of HSP90 ATPase